MADYTCRSCHKPLRRHYRNRELGANEQGALGSRPTPAQAAKVLEVPAVGRVYQYFQDKLPRAVSVWDGKAYGWHGENAFCNGECAKRFARAVARGYPKMHLVSKE